MADEIGGRTSIANIPTETIRETLRQTMVMALSTVVADRPTFVFEGEQDYQYEDREGSPWDWTDSATADSSKDSIQVLCAYEFFSPLGRQGAFLTEVGEFNPSTVVITMFEDEFAAIQGFTYVNIGPSIQSFYFRFYKPSVSLNDLTVYQVTCVASGTD